MWAFPPQQLIREWTASVRLSREKNICVKSRLLVICKKKKEQKKKRKKKDVEKHGLLEIIMDSVKSALTVFDL